MAQCPPSFVDSSSYVANCHKTPFGTVYLANVMIWTRIQHHVQWAVYFSQMPVRDTDLFLKSILGSVLKAHSGLRNLHA